MCERLMTLLRLAPGVSSMLLGYFTTTLTRRDGDSEQSTTKVTERQGWLLTHTARLIADLERLYVLRRKDSIGYIDYYWGSTGRMLGSNRPCAGTSFAGQAQNMDTVSVESLRMRVLRGSV